MRLPYLFRSATRPFTFYGCLELRGILGRRARDERELMQLMRRMGEAGREHVRENFLITRHLRDYLSLLAHLSR